MHAHTHEKPRRPRLSLITMSALDRLLGVAVLLIILWTLVAWALGANA
ncbi:hypothetical protein [Craterilacuibacter sp. RT1T]|nr:hypothetical protein [Craterilacuibacter sp. RT1T]MCL6263143.1 hypothetical protein [Craterilacuibacter sp. RT1T]